jgi:ATP synthase subunit 6
MLVFSPLEQFEIQLFPFFSFGGIFFSNSVLYMIIVFFAVLWFFYFLASKSGFVPNPWQLMNELFYGTVMDLVKQQIGLKGEKFLPFMYMLFVFILMSNCVGLLPYSFTVTGQFLVTLSLAFSSFIGVVIIGFVTFKLHFLSFFVPTGVSKALVPFLVVIEVISYLIRPFSLAIRLFANMLAGHTLLHILAAFVFYVSKQSYLVMIFPFLFLFAITLLEIGIAFIQAYVFIILICIYLNDSLNLHH